MPKISNVQDTLVLNIDLINNNRLDVVKGRSEFENWIPFKFLLQANNEILEYSPNSASFTVWETQKIINGFEELIDSMKKGEKVKTFAHYCNEVYFEIKIIADPRQNNEINFELWINMPNITEGSIYGFDKGYRFAVSLSSFITFTEALKQQLIQIINTNN